MVKKPNYQATTESLKIVENLALSAKVKVGLNGIAPKIKVVADDGTVFLTETDDNLTAKNEEQIKKIAMQIEGVKEVTINKKVVREQYGHVNPFQNIG